MANGKRGSAAGGEHLSATGRFALTGRILAVNILPLLFLGGGLFYLDSYRTQLVNERFKLARIEAQITAEALAGATRARQEALLVQIGKEQRMRLRTFDVRGKLTADSFALADPSFRFNDISDDDWDQRFSGWLDRTVDTIVSAQAVQDYVEPEAQEAAKWLQTAAAKGHVGAMSFLGAWHYEGRCVVKSEALAREWLEKAAQAGDPDAKTMLASLFGKR